MLLAYISWLKSQTNDGYNTRECDYYKIMALALPQFFNYINNWCLVSEYNLAGNYSPDYLVSIINITPVLDYGSTSDLLSCEIQNHAAVSWWVIMKDQLWDQTDAAKHEDGTFWVVAQIGFKICFFRFNVNGCPSSSDIYTNFSFLNLYNFTIDDLIDLKIKYITETTNSVISIRVIKWRWDDQNQLKYIEAMFNHINNNRPS